jgi:tetratricopeptide (TPR) repeat protein
MPFDTPQGDPASYWLGEAASVIVTDALSALGLPAMDRADRLRAFELLRVPAIRGLSQATMMRVGRVVGVSQIVVGQIERRGDTLTVRARTIALDAGSLGPEVSETGPLGEMFDIHYRLAGRLAPGDVSSLAGRIDLPSVAAFEQFIKGLLASAPQARLAFLAEATRISPSLHRARIAAWDVHHELGDHEAALAAVGQVPGDHVLDRPARFRASVSLLEMGRYDAAFDALTALLAGGREAAVLNNLGVVQLRRPGDAGGRAVSYFNEAASLEAGVAYFNLGYAYWIDGDAAASALWLREAVRRDPADHAAHYVLGAALAATGNATEASRETELARRLDSVYDEWAAKPAGESVPAGLERVRTDLDATGDTRLESVIGAAGQRDQQDLATFHLESGRRAFDTGRDGEAISSLRRAVYLSPYDHEAHLLLGRAYQRSGRLADAIDAFTISIWSRDTTAARLDLARAHAASGSRDEAVTELRRIVEREPANLEAQALLESLAPQ